MSSTGAGYDDSCSTYSPDGKLFQVEYAAKAVAQSGTSIGVRCKDGVILGVEKILQSRMLVSTSNRKIMNVDKHVGVAVSGWAADARQLVNRAREEARAYHNNYGVDISPKTLTERLGGFMHAYTCYWYLRPFGASVILAGYDSKKKEPVLSLCEPNGECYRYFGCAIGKGSRAAKTEIEKQKFGEKTCRESLGLLAKILLLTHEDSSSDKPYKLEMSWVCEETKWQHKRISDDTIKEAEEWAKKSMDEDDEDSDDDSDDDDDDEDMN